jgi:hypothetical protein
MDIFNMRANNWIYKWLSSRHRESVPFCVRDGERVSEAVEVQTTSAGRGLLVCFLLPLALLAAGGILGWFDRTTQLTPNHDEVLQFCFLIAGLAGLAFGGLAIRESKGMALWRRIAIGFCVAAVGFLAVFLVTSRSADLIEGYIDFPPAKTKTYPALLIISRPTKRMAKAGAGTFRRHRYGPT